VTASKLVGRNPKIGGSRFLKKLVHTYQITRRHVPEDSNLDVDVENPNTGDSWIVDVTVGDDFLGFLWSNTGDSWIVEVTVGDDFLGFLWSNISHQNGSYSQWLYRYGCL
jgi:hypothetical protein